jgi:glycosidase
VRSVLASEAEARMAARLLFTLPGHPFVYYGEEIGMRGQKPDPHIREPYLWTRSPDSLRPDWIPPEYSTDSTVTPLRTQRQHEDSLWNLYRRLITLRKQQPALHDGGLRPVASPDTSVALFVRTHADGDLLVAHNVGSNVVKFVLPESLRTFDQRLYRSPPAAQRQSETLVLPAQSTLILQR